MTQLSEVSTLKSAFVARNTAVTQLTLVLAGTIFLSVMAQIAFPIPGSPVPVTGQTLGVLLLGTAYGAGLGFSTMAFYLLIGILGAPVFASGSHGLERVIGATGGYLVGMLFASLVLGALAGRKWDQKIRTVIPTMIIGSTIVFTFGLIWLQQFSGQSWSWTLEKGLLPFLPGEILKIAIASTALPTLWRFISKRSN
ncbi:MAG: biotin transporter BioY [Actinomycetota bacterium]|jgi:biotin transport system substrate-specific component|tara:strand:- start:2081 stop:2671 length:591 start_codon:yes stop_codon:yes gene_type:complete